MIDTLRDESNEMWDEHNSLQFVGDNDSPASSVITREVMVQIIARIEARLPGRIRGLFVSQSENAIVLGGSCSTYYSKQIAQHTAMGVLEYERLINNIKVLPPK